MKAFMREFKEFINRGNVMDMAVGVVIGGAFSQIVTSLVDNVIMPLVGMIIGGIDFGGLAVTVQGATLKYGLFIQSVVDFLIVAFVIFSVIKAINRMQEKLIPKKDEGEPEPEPIPEDIALLTEIRDLMKDKK